MVQSLAEDGIAGKKGVLLETPGPQAGGITIDALGVATIAKAGAYTVSYGIVTANSSNTSAWAVVQLEMNGTPLDYAAAQGIVPGGDSLRLVSSGQFSFNAGDAVGMTWFGESFAALRISDGDSSGLPAVSVSPSYAWLTLVLISETGV